MQEHWFSDKFIIEFIITVECNWYLYISGSGKGTYRVHILHKVSRYKLCYFKFSIVNNGFSLAISDDWEGLVSRELNEDLFKSYKS